MGVFAISDLHLSLGADKSMDVFAGWEGYVGRIDQNWRRAVSDGDTVVIAGDISWGMTLGEALPDFQFLDALPGRKLLVKGNHDYWWTTARKMTRFFEEHGLFSLSLLHNSACSAAGIALCGTRGWIFEENGDVSANDRKVLEREVGRLRTSLSEGDKTGLPLVAFLHYPPLYAQQRCPEILGVLREFGVRRCLYGHIHGQGARMAVTGEVDGIGYTLISADYRGFCPIRVE